MNNELTDAAIVEGFRENNRHIIQHVYNQYGPIIKGYVIKNQGNQADADLVLTNTVTQVWENIQDEKYDDRGKFGGYLMTIAVYCWRGELRRRKKVVLKADVYENNNQTPIDEDQTEFLRAKEQKLEALGNALNQLAIKDQTLIEERYFLNKKVKEIAEELGMDYDYLKQRMMTLRRRLRKWMK